MNNDNIKLSIWKGNQKVDLNIDKDGNVLQKMRGDFNLTRKQEKNIVSAVKCVREWEKRIREVNE